MDVDYFFTKFIAVEISFLQKCGSFADNINMASFCAL